MIAAPAFAVTTGEAEYLGGTVAGTANGTIGALDTTAAEKLVFRYKPSPTIAASTAATSAEIEIPYASIQSFQYSTEVTYHIGVLPAIAVSLVKKRMRKHFFTISYTDLSKTTQVVVLEVPKDEPKVLLPILRARASQACGKVAANFCGGTLPH